MSRRARILLKPVLALSLAVALAMVSFGHRGAAQEISPELGAYLAGGGLLSDLCAGTDDAGYDLPTPCDACRISSGLHLPPPSATGAVVAPPVVQTRLFIAKRLRFSRGLDPARQTRAPPQA